MLSTIKNKTLTEEELLKMPEKAYMNEEQLAYFKELLLQQEAEILAQAKKTTQAMQEQDNNFIADPSDRATVEEEYSLELKTRDRERKLLIKIRKALDLIANKKYGYCEDTGEPIGLRRLLARPTATLSVEAQERREKLQKHFFEQ